MRPPEFWVMRIAARPNPRTGGLLLPGQQRDATERELEEIAQLVAKERLHAMHVAEYGGNMFVEPIECYVEQQLADERADRERRAHPAESYLVLINADLDEGG